VELEALEHDEQVARINVAAAQALKSYPFEAVEIELINFEYNATFRVKSSAGLQAALRININSSRTVKNTEAEIAFVQHLQAESNFQVADPIANLSGDYVTSFDFPPLGRRVTAVLFSWLEGEEMGEEPTLAQVELLGATIARMHQATKEFTLPRGNLPSLADFFAGEEELLFSANSPISDSQSDEIKVAVKEIESILAELYKRFNAQVLHADLHRWNVFFDRDEISIIDFDDSAVGLPIQDIAIAIYYLDTEEEDAALLKGYGSVAPLPEYSDREMSALLLQRRLLLLNYLIGSSTQEHRDMIPVYLEETMRRVSLFL